MRSRIQLILFIFVSFILLVDGITFTGLAADFPAILQPVPMAVFWSVTMIFIIRLLFYGRTFLADSQPGFFAGFYVFTGFFLACYVSKLFYTAFLLLEFALKPLIFTVVLVVAEPGPFGEFMWSGPLNFISKLILPVAVLATIVILYGMVFGRFNYRVRRISLSYTDLPPAFENYRIVHISDLHLGSLYGHQAQFKRAVHLIKSESPDLILFTGDLVNNLAEETRGWEVLLAGLQATEGKYAILGNHDYGEYYDWHDEKSHQDNMNKLVRAHQDAGFTLLLNRSVKISRKGEDIFLAGVENWGLPPFKQYGELTKALEGIPGEGFTILLSHDPSHWDEEVAGQSRVHLTLSGHTHGMQFGIRLGKFRWSPIQMKYPRWIGLYQQGYQYLHVNPGLGYIGYAGRIGIPPEISVITLRRSTS
jgi:predicted MPP superfamily phosphohydrolase